MPLASLISCRTKDSYVLVANLEAGGRHNSPGAVRNVPIHLQPSHARPVCVCARARLPSQDLATPLCWDVDELAHFCTMGQFEVSLVPQGTLLTPPAKNEYDRDAFDAYEKESSKKDPVDVRRKRLRTHRLLRSR